jgi:hypothetical protein
MKCLDQNITQIVIGDCWRKSYKAHQKIGDGQADDGVVEVPDVEQHDQLFLLRNTFEMFRKSFREVTKLFI